VWHLRYTSKQTYVHITYISTGMLVLILPEVINHTGDVILTHWSLMARLFYNKKGIGESMNVNLDLDKSHI